MNTEKFYEKIEQFLDGEGTDEERAQFQQSMLADPTLAREVELHRTMQAALGETDVLQLEALLRKVGSETRLEATAEQAPRGARIVPFFRKYRALAAGLAVLLVAAVVMQLFLGKNADPFAQYHETYPLYLETRSDGPSQSDLLKKAALAYRGGEFEAAFGHFSSLASQTKGQPEELGYRFYAGLSALEAGKTADAAALLAPVSAQPDHIYAAQADWYLALTFLKSGDKAAAKTQLHRIVAKKTERSAQAEKLLKELD